MTAYLIINVNVTDRESYAKYREQVPALIERHGGAYLARGGRSRALEGNWLPSRLVLVAFPDEASAIAFMEDPDYRPLRLIRERSARSDIVLVDGDLD